MSTLKNIINPLNEIDGATSSPKVRSKTDDFTERERVDLFPKEIKEKNLKGEANKHFLEENIEDEFSQMCEEFDDEIDLKESGEEAHEEEEEGKEEEAG